MDQRISSRGSVISLFVVILASVVSGQQLTIEFAEVDRDVVESLGPATITVNKDNENVGDLHLTITPLTFSDFSSMGFVLPSEIDISNIDPAEGGDFDNAVQTVVFPASLTEDSMSVSFPINDDDIHEDDEGFLVVIQIDETLSDQQDVDNAVFTRNGVALITIRDDDPITLMFEQAGYTFNEDQGSFQNAVLIIKADGRQTELDFDVVLQATDGNAIQGEDYEVSGATLQFPAQDQTMPIIGEIIDDNIFELDHSFTLALGGVPGATYLVGPSVLVTIQDNEMAVIGFEQTEYTAGEGDGTVQVCVVLLQPDGITIPQFDASIIQISTTSMGSTAQENDDYTPLPPGEFVQINSLLNQRDCFDIQINDDSVAESTETVRVILTGLALIERTTLDPTEATVSILDNDGTSPGGMGGDPHYSIPLPTGQLLCFSVQGEKGFSFNLISNKLMHMNALFIQDPQREEITWIGALGIVVKNSTYRGRSDITKLRFDASDKKVYIDDKVALYINNIDKLTFSNGKLTISEATSYKKEKHSSVAVDLLEAGLSFTVRFTKNHLDLFWNKVNQQPSNSHGMIGQFFRSGVEIDEARKLLMLPTMDPVPVMRKPVWHFMEREVPDDQLCWVAMNPGYQGKRLIEGHYLDYLVDDVLTTNFNFEIKDQ